GWGRSGRRVEGRGSPAPQCRPRLKGRFDRSLQTDARARPARPDGGASSGASVPPKLKGRFDRSLQTDARAKPARPDGGTASGALTRGWRAELKRYGAPLAFLAAVTIAVLLVRNGLEANSSPAPTTVATTTATTTPATKKPRRPQYYRL